MARKLLIAGRQTLGTISTELCGGGGSQGFKQVVAGERHQAGRETNRFIVSRTEFARRGSVYSADGRSSRRATTFELSELCEDRTAGVLPRSEAGG
jgi:hypothetical protein